MEILNDEELEKIIREEIQEFLRDSTHNVYPNLNCRIIDLEKSVKFLKELITIAVGTKLLVEEVREIKKSPIEEKPIEDLELGIRAENGLKADNIINVSQLLELCERDILKIPNIGKTSLERIKGTLERRGLKLKVE